MIARRFNRLRSHYLEGGLTRDEFVQDCLSCVFEAARSASGMDDLHEAVGAHDVYTDCLLVLAAELQAGLAGPSSRHERFAGDDSLAEVRDQVLARLINPGGSLGPDRIQAVDGGPGAGSPDEDRVWLAIELVSQMSGPGARATLDLLGWIAHRQGWADLASTAAARLPDLRPGWSPGLQLAMLHADPRLAGEPGLLLDAALTVAEDHDNWDEAALARLTAVANDLLLGGDPPDVNRLSRAALALWRRGAHQEAERLSGIAAGERARSGWLSPELWALDVAPVAGLRLRLGHVDEARALAMEVRRLSDSWRRSWFGLQSTLITSWVMAETADDPQECLMWCEQIPDINHSTLGPLKVRVNRLTAAAYERLGDQNAACESETAAEAVAQEGRPLSLHLSEAWALRWLMWDLESLPLNLLRR